MSSSSPEIVFPAAGAVGPDRPVPQLPTQWSNLGSALVAQVLRTPDKLLVVDGTGQKATYRDALLRAAAISRVISRKAGPSAYVGIMIPPSVGAAIANYAVTLSGKVAVNINYALGDAVANSPVEQCGMDTVLTSRTVLKKTGIKLNASNVILLEDVAKEVGTLDKGLSWAIANLLPTPAMRLLLPGLRSGLEDIATVMFTSGSTGDSKGVLLSHSNILHNVAQLSEHAGLGADEVILGKLPFFHSYGFTGTLWSVACLGYTVVCHHNPLDPRGVGELMEKHGVTVMASTPTLMRSYLKRCTREQFGNVHWLQLGSEKMKPELARDIKDKLGVEPVEGYGATELSPCVASSVNRNVASAADPTKTVWGNRPGSVGQPVPGTAVAVVDMKTGRLLPRGKDNEGILFWAGPQVMKGYLGKEKQTAEVLRNGWYLSNDIGWVDEDGFIYITDRLSRFAKIGGEMVPIILVESAVRQIAGVDELSVAIAAVPDDAKGEKLVVMYTSDSVNPTAIVAQLQAQGMNNLWIPKASDYHKVEAFPTAATGKLDLKGIKKMAMELSGLA